MSEPGGLVVLIFSWCGLNHLLVDVCYGTAKSAEIVSRDMWASTGQHADCAGGEFPFIYWFGCVGGFF